jgi:hypothetical protein
MIHQKIDAVVFGGDGIGMLFGNALDDVSVFDIEFEAAVGARLGGWFR